MCANIHKGLAGTARVVKAEESAAIPVDRSATASATLYNFSPRTIIITPEGSSPKTDVSPWTSTMVAAGSEGGQVHLNSAPVTPYGPHASFSRDTYVSSRSSNSAYTSSDVAMGPQPYRPQRHLERSNNVPPTCLYDKVICTSCGRNHPKRTVRRKY